MTTLEEDGAILFDGLIRFVALAHIKPTECRERLRTLCVERHAMGGTARAFWGEAIKLIDREFE